jgi:hypothetical protein
MLSPNAVETATLSSVPWRPDARSAVTSLLDLGQAFALPPGMSVLQPGAVIPQDRGPRQTTRVAYHCEARQDRYANTTGATVGREVPLLLKPELHHFRRAAREVGRHGDNDTLPFDIDVRFCGDEPKRLPASHTASTRNFETAYARRCHHALST